MYSDTVEDQDEPEVDSTAAGDALLEYDCRYVASRIPLPWISRVAPLLSVCCLTYDAVTIYNREVSKVKQDALTASLPQS